MAIRRSLLPATQPLFASASLVAILVGACCPSAVAQTAAGPAAEIVRMGEAGTGQTPGGDTAQVAGWGTAFVVAPGYLVTNAHVATGTIRLLDTDSGVRYPVRIVARDEDNDLALLHAPVPGAPLPLAAGVSVPALQRAFVLGYPDPAKYGMARKFAIGRVRTPASADGMEPMTLFMSALPGNSGSPLCNDKGQVIGVIKGGLTAPLLQNNVASRTEPVPVATPLEPLLALLARQGIAYVHYGLAGPLEKLGEALAPSVYLVERTERPGATAVR
jgi:S1-C subfamily serine protease